MDKSICNKCGIKTLYEGGQPCKAIYWNKAGDEYDQKCNGTLMAVDNSDLNPRAQMFYNRSERVEITYKDGEKVRCWIGKSTGWKPVFLEILRRDSIGGGALYLPEDAQIRGLGIYK